MSVIFSEKLSRIPGYQAGVPKGKSADAVAASDLIQLASNESPIPPHPAVIEAIERAASAMNRYPDPEATALCKRLGERYDLDPSRIAVSNGSCEILLAAAMALCEPGAEILYSWPAFSMYPMLAPLTGAREIRVPLDDEDRHDLDAMLAEITAATQLVLICNPNNPTATFLPAERIADFCERAPSHVTIICDEAYIEFQQQEDPDTTVELLDRFPNLVLLRTFSKAYGLAGLRVGYALSSATFRNAVDAVRQPFSVNALAQVAAAEAIRRSDDMTERVERIVAERLFVEERLGELGLATSRTEANFSWIDLGEVDEKAVIEALAAESIIVRGGTPLGGPGHIRVSYGTRSDNEKFLTALAAALQAAPAA